jgi:hypothetical protein
MPLRIRELHPPFAAEVSGVNISRALSPAAPALRAA